jgi:hypothetical protein
MTLGVTHALERVQQRGRDFPMKRLLSIALALTLMGSSVAMARGYQGGGYSDRHGYNGYSAPNHGGYGYRDRDNNAAAAVGVGILALGLFAALASQHDNDRYSSGYYAPPPRSGYGAYGPGYGSSPGYGSGYGGYYGYGR